jgi:hypothetical protein
MKERIIELLGRGIPAVNVAMAVGCDESYISQIVSQPGVADQISAMKMAHFAEFTELDDSVNEAEKAALTKLKQLVPFITKPAEAARVYSVLNAAKRRTADVANSSRDTPSTIVSIELPQAARVAFITDTNRQVIEIDSRPLVTMPAQSLVALSEQKRAAKLLDMRVPQILDISPTKLSEQL